MTNRRKVGMTSSHHGPYGQGYTYYNGRDRGLQAGDGKPIPETLSQSGLSLQLDSMKSESLVIADQHCCGEYVPGPCTHRPSHHGSLLHQKQVA